MEEEEATLVDHSNSSNKKMESLLLLLLLRWHKRRNFISFISYPFTNIKNRELSRLYPRNALLVPSPLLSSFVHLDCLPSISLLYVWSFCISVSILCRRAPSSRVVSLNTSKVLVDVQPLLLFIQKAGIESAACILIQMKSSML